MLKCCLLTCDMVQRKLIPNMTTAASRPGGKFAKSGTAASRPGGKFASLASKTAECSKDTSNGTTITSPEVTREVLSAKRAKLTRHVVFDDLENAEQLAMETLTIASSTAEAFCHLAQNTQTDEKKGSETDKQTARQLQHRIRKNGQEFLSKIKKIHDLLAPHASIVKTYENLPSSEKATGASSNTESSRLKGDIYLSRLEMRLAVERRELLREIVQSKDGGARVGQESENSSLIKSDDVFIDSISEKTKRKRED